jgi:serine/threonine protein phosphatase PrpC
MLAMIMTRMVLLVCAVRRYTDSANRGEPFASVRHNIHQESERLRIYTALSDHGRNPSSAFDRTGYAGGLEPTRTLGDVDVKQKFGRAPVITCVPECQLFAVDETALCTVLIMGSDGLFDTLTTKQISDIVCNVLVNHRDVTSRDTAKTISLQLAEDAVLEGTHDDVTALVALISPARTSR